MCPFVSAKFHSLCSFSLASGPMTLQPVCQFTPRLKVPVFLALTLSTDL